MAQPTRSVTLLAQCQARSDDPEADSFEQPLLAPAVHPFTGTFADAEHTVAFGSKAFRLVFPLHVVALALLVCVEVSVVMTLSTEPGRPLMAFLLVPTLLAVALGLGARIAVHCWNCHARAQRFGAIAWTINVAFVCTADVLAYALSPKLACQIPSSLASVYPMCLILFAVLNASHGMEFWHTASLAGLVLCDLIAARAVCPDSAPVSLAVVALAVTFGAGHFAQLLARRAFLQSEHIHMSRERLEHDFRRLEYRLSGLGGPRLPPIVTPTASSSASDSSASTPERRASSAPAAMDAGHTALPAGLVLRQLMEWPPPHTTHQSSAGPSTAGPSTAGPSTAADPLSASVALSASTPSYSPLPPVSASVVTLSSVSHLDSEAVLNAPATSNPGRNPHIPALLTVPTRPLLALTLPQRPTGTPTNPYLPRSRPLFTLSIEDRARRRQLEAQMESARQVQQQEDQASEGLSQHGDAPAQPWGSWSSSNPSSATRNRRRRNREIYELRRGISAPANPAAARRCPYI